jgi:DNA-binding MarR family transcriptional regulator
MSTLKAELGVTATNVTALIDGLERDGLVERRPHPSDRRATLIHARTKKDCAGYRERVAEVFETTLTEEERRELLCLLDKILTALPASEVPDNRR